MKTKRLNRMLLAALLLAGGQGAPRAQQYSVGWSVIADGGGTSSGVQYSMSGTIGQWGAGGPIVGNTDSVTSGFWQRPGGPSLTIARASATTLVISWPAASLGCFALQQSSSLSSPDWVNAPNAVSFANGTDQVTVTIAGSQMYYRLVSPCP